MRFAKLHGLGNDFLLLDLRAGGEPLPAARALQLCDRHRGVGGDGVLTLLPGGRMLVQNADGSVPEMCGKRRTMCGPLDRDRRLHAGGLRGAWIS